MIARNIMATASRAIPMVSYPYFKYTGETTDDLGIINPTYTQSTIKANIQPIKKAAYEQFGLSLQKVYYRIFTYTPLQYVARDKMGDKLTYNGKTIQIEDNNGEWKLYAINSYIGVQID